MRRNEKEKNYKKIRSKKGHKKKAREKVESGRKER